ncbi:MAG: AarF/UbiB family protein, partial [Myxococcota bacterium]
SIEAFIKTASPEAKQRAGITLAELFFEMAFVHRTLHADPHPGNYLFHDDGTVSMLDFGCVKRFNEFWIGTYARAVLAAFEGDRATLLQACRDLGAWTGDDPEAGDAITNFCETVVAPWQVGLYTLGSDDMLQRVQPHVRRMWSFREIRGPRDIIFLHRTLGGLYTLARRLDVRYDWGAMLRHYLHHAIAVAEGRVDPETHPGAHHTIASAMASGTPNAA